MTNTKPNISIIYCTGCKWLTRSAWMAQELLDTFSEDLESVSLSPAKVSGEFKILLDKKIIWDRKLDSGFPSAKELKKRVRDEIDPKRSLGHLDTKV